MVRQIPSYTPQNEKEPAMSLGNGLTIRWQHGPMEGNGNGSGIEQVLIAVRDRLMAVDALIPCSENKNAIRLVNLAIQEMDKRIADRYKRGVLGTTAK